MLQSAGWNYRTAAFVATLVMAAAAIGCPKSETAAVDAGSPASSAPAKPSALAAAEPDAAAPQSPASPAAPVERMTAPLKLVLKGPTPPPEKGDFQLAVDIVANEPIVRPLKMTIELPAGAKLVKGAKEESITIKAAGTTTREFTIHVDAPLSTPVVVSAETRDETGGIGLRAVRKYPAGGDAPPAASSTASVAPRSSPPPR